MTGCGAFAGNEFYAEVFPEMVIKGEHTIAHLELLNVVVALKVWALEWSKKRVRVSCDNTNACRAIQSGRSRNDFMQKCVRELFLWCARYDVELVAVHCPGVKLVRVDALSRVHTHERFRVLVENDEVLKRSRRVRVREELFELRNDL